MKLCIICFLNDLVQVKLRNLAQSRNDRFENTLESYRDDFIFQYKNLIPINDCENHKSLSRIVIQWATNLKKSLPVDSDVENLFNDIINVYTEWINSDSQSAFSIMEQLLEKVNYKSKRYTKSKKIFFRARKSEKHLSKEELYHIPFNKRYLIGNQRYSISGQPCLYFGLSIPDVVSELRGNYDDYKQYNFSGYMLKEGCIIDILKFTNEFPGLFSIIDDLALAGGKIEFDSPGLKPNKADCIEYFYLYILICCSSFERRLRSEGHVFSEEYVLPQIITQFAYKKNYDGIAFSSTRIDNKKIYSKATYFQDEYKLNLVLFTKYTKGKIYDEELLNKFIISEPKKAESFECITEDELSDLTKEIVAINNVKNVFSSLADIAGYTGIGTDADFKDVFLKTSSGEKRYFEHELGQFHIFLLYSFLLDIRSRIA